jgi:predicted ATPase/class 3 adenylate cyclase
VDDPPVRVSVLGPVEVVRGGSPVRLGGPQQRRVLALLTVHANDVVSSDRLIDALWSEVPPASASHTLQASVSRLRGVLGGERIETVAPGYRLCIERDAVDALRFEDLVDEARACAARPEDAVARYGAALEMWRGVPYSEFADEEFALGEVTRLDELRLCAVAEHAAALVDLDHPDEVVAPLEAAIVSAPFREALRAVLMSALARAGRPVEALRAFESYRQMLAEEVGVVPSAALQVLNDDILRQHPDVSWERSSTSAVVELPAATVTFLFTDLEGSTRLWEEHPDAMVGALARHNEILREAVSSHDGYQVKETGDGIHAAFANATDAVDAAIDAQLALYAEPWPEATLLRARMGVHTGEAGERDGDYYGPTLNHAARLMGIAHGGQVVCSGAVEQLARGRYDLQDLGLHQLRDVESAMHVYQVNAPGLELNFPPLSSLDAYRSNLPRELSGFVGRADDVNAVAKALGESRVVSIVGVGGVGKTRLALRVGSELRSEYDDGVWWCELAGVRNADAVPQAVAAALGYTPSQGVSTTEGLSAFFRHKHLLLVLDNCEHLLVPVGTFVRTIAEVASQLSVLTTSREPMGIRGERTYPLPAFELPVDPSPFSVAQSEAGALFATRARDARATFNVTEENAAAIADLCSHLDGNALAIELAAARTAVMSPSEILARLDHRFRLLATRSSDAVERHQTLHAAIDWSYALLDPQEQTLLQWLSVFVGDFDLPAAVAIAVAAGLDEFDAIDGLSSLVTKSLVERLDTPDTSRYRLLETIRQYADERLSAEGDLDRARDRHAAHYLSAAHELLALLDSPRDFEALERLRLATPNLAAGLRWLLESGQLGEVLGFFADVGWVDSGLVPFEFMEELGRIGDEAVRRHGAGQTRGYVDALFFVALRALYIGDWDRYRHVVSIGTEADPDSLPMHMMGFGDAMTRADFPAAIAIIASSVERAREIDNPRLLSYALGLRSLGEVALGTDPAAALAYAEECVTVVRGYPARSPLVYALNMLGIAALRSDPDLALAAAEECIRLDQTHRKLWSTLSAGTAAMLRVNRGEIATGFRLFNDHLHRLHWSGEVFNFATQLPGIAEYIAGNDPERAIQLAAIIESDAIAASPIFDAPVPLEWLTRLVDELGPEQVAAARRRAASMTYDEAIGYVFDSIDRVITEAEADEGGAL